MRMFALLSAALILAPAATPAATPNVVTGIGIAERGASTEVTVRASNPPSFTTFSLVDPPRFVIDLSEATFEGVTRRTAGAGVVKEVTAISFGEGVHATARITVTFLGDVEPPDVKVSGAQLIVRVDPRPGTAVAGAAPPVAPVPAAPPAPPPAPAVAAAPATPPAPAAPAVAASSVVAAAPVAPAAPAPVVAAATPPAPPAAPVAAPASAAATTAAATSAASAAAAAEAEQARARQQAKEAEARALAAEAEARAAAEARALADAKAAAETRAAIEARAAADARAAAEARAVAEARAAADARVAADARAAEEARLAAEAKARAAAAAAAASRPVAPPAPGAAAPAPVASASPVMAAPSPSPKPVVATTGPNQIEFVGFKQLPQGSRVFVRTKNPPRFIVSEPRENLVRVEFPNTQVPLRNDLNFLDTSFFPTAVAKVTPVRSGRSYVLEILLRERVAWQQRIDGDTLSLDFDRPAAAKATAAPAK
jgi:colicin import membrane protein